MPNGEARGASRLAGEASSAEGATLTDVLAAVIGKAFEHEREFLTRFWCGDPNDELLECYMASERTRIAVLVESGATVTDTIPTEEFIEWAEAANEKIQGAERSEAPAGMEG